MKRVLSVLIVLSLAAVPMFAAPQQATNQQWEVVRAEYGQGNHWADVTARVRALIQNEFLNFRADNATLGVDPVPGKDKVLRLLLQDRTGQRQQFEFWEYDQVRLNAFQGGLHITRAVYGEGQRWNDVTARMNAQVQGNQLHLQVNNSTMGGDPAPNRSKTLRVDYTFDGRAQQAVIQEGDTLRLNASSASDYSQSRLQVTRAIYGEGNRWHDVTARMNAQIQGNQLHLQVNNDAMGGDPSPGRSKTLRVDYTLDGRTQQAEVREGDRLRLNSGTVSSNQQGRLQITRAVYGEGNRQTDVTARLRSRIQDDQLHLQVNNDTMGGNPGRNRRRALHVDYTFDGRAGQMVLREGDTLSLPYGATPELARRFRCESLQSGDSSRKYCPADTRGGVRLSRRLSEAACTQNSTWGYDQGGVWVSNGCRAEFEMQQVRTLGSLTSATIPNGTELSLRTNEVIDSETSVVGQTFSALVAADVLDSSGAVVIPRNSDARLVIRSADGGSITRASELLLDVDSLTIAGTTYVISTGDLQEQGGQGVGVNRRTGIMVGGGAALGTLIGAIIGGGKGAAIGAAIGAGSGAGAQILTRGKQVKIPAETLLSFRLDQDLVLQAAR
jgi:hypothetical protein